VAHLNAAPDVDGAIRTEALAITYYDEFYSVARGDAVAKSLNLTAKDIQIRPEKRCRSAISGERDPQMQMYTYFYKDREGRTAIPRIPSLTSRAARSRWKNIATRSCS